MLLASSVLAVLLGLVVSVGPFLFDYVVLGEGPVWSRNSWPSELHTIMDELPDAARNDVRGVKVYCFENFINQGYVWRFTIPQEAYHSLTQSFDTVKLTTLDPTDSFWHQRPRWWDPNPNADAEFVSWIDSRIGIVMVTMYDRKNQVLYGWSYFVF